MKISHPRIIDHVPARDCQYKFPDSFKPFVEKKGVFDFGKERPSHLIRHDQSLINIIPERKSTLLTHKYRKSNNYLNESQSTPPRARTRGKSRKKALFVTT